MIMCERVRVQRMKGDHIVRDCGTRQSGEPKLRVCAAKRCHRATVLRIHIFRGANDLCCAFAPGEWVLENVQQIVAR